MKKARILRSFAGILILSIMVSICGCSKSETKKRNSRSTRRATADKVVTVDPDDPGKDPTPEPTTAKATKPASTPTPWPTPQPDFSTLELSDEYLVGFDYCSYDLWGMDPIIIAKVRYDQKIEAEYEYTLLNGETIRETKVFDLTDAQFASIRSGIDLKKLYELDPQEMDPSMVDDGGSTWLIIYGKDGEAVKVCGGFCCRNKQYNAMRRVIFENLPEDFEKEYELCCRKENFRDAYRYGRYGVYLSEKKTPADLRENEIVVIDAQNYTADEIQQIKYSGCYVFSYINVGSLENFRDYYDEYKDLCLGDYEHWEDEKWVDVTSEKWQAFILEELAPEMVEKGCDGFFVDNCDVYYQYPTDQVLEALGTIMRGLVSTRREVIMNGGDAFIDAYTEKIGPWSEVITGINQETVFTRIDWDSGELRARNTTDDEYIYYTEYIEKYAEQGVYIFLLEYTQNAGIEQKIAKYCRDHSFAYYISDSVDLD